ncbi:hypothetical protein ACTXT7_000611 [Hymenolepis weldensis]
MNSDFIRLAFILSMGKVHSILSCHYFLEDVLFLEKLELRLDMLFIEYAQMGFDLVTPDIVDVYINRYATGVQFVSPDRVHFLLDNGIASFLFNALEAAHPRKSHPPPPQTTSGKVSRSNSRLGNLAIRPKALSISQSINTGLGVAATRGTAAYLTSAEQEKKRRRVSELQVLTVCLVHAIYEASMDSLAETLNILPPYCIASVVADLMSETDSLEKSIEVMFTPQSEIRDDSSLNNSNSTTATSRSGNIFSSLKFSKNLLNPGALSRISRMNSIGSDSQISPSLSVATTNQLPSLSVQHLTLTQKPLVDSTPITDEKRVSVLTDPMEINLRDILINLQHFIIQPYINLLNAQPNERQMHRALRDLCRLIRPDITSSSNSSNSGVSTEVNPKVEIYRDPHKPDDDFKIPPKMLSVICLSSLVKHRGDLIHRILENRSPLENDRSISPVIAWLETDKIGGHPDFPLMSAVRTVALVLCQVLDTNNKSSVEDEQLNTLLFQSSPNADSVFLELFLHCFDAFYSIWFAVNAAPYDLERKSISRALDTSLSNTISTCPNTFDEFARTLANFSLDSIRKSWKMRDEEREKNHLAVQELHRDLVKQHTETVTKQRLYTMSHGQPLTYMKITKKGPLSSILSVSSHTENKKNKNREWLVVLTIDTEQATEKDADSLPRPLSAKQQSRHNQIVLNAPSEYIQTSWIDGFSCLRKEKFTSAAFADDVNLISNLELRIRLFGLNLDSVPSRAIELLPSYPDLTGLFTLDGIEKLHVMVSHIKCNSASLRSTDEILNILSVDIKYGLSNAEASCRLEQIGPNEFKADPPDPLWLKYLKQFLEPMIGLLIASAFISVLMGQFDDAVSISAAIFIVVTVGFIQGYRSERAIESLKNLREGKVQSILASTLVPGDVVYLSLGDRVPADLRIIESSDLRIDESNLTGENKPIAKHSNSIPSHISEVSLTKPLETSPSSLSLDSGDFPSSVIRRTDSFNSCSWADGETIISFENATAAAVIPPQRIEGAHRLTNIGFMGTLVRAGNAIGVVIATGEYSEFGEVFKMMQNEEAPRTPLQKSMDRLGKHLSMISGAIIFCIVVVGLIQGRNILELITVAVSLAVAAIPEGLPIVVTVTLAIGQMRMAARNAIIKKLPAVETLGCVNVICADKTGTMTKNEMTVTGVVTGGLERADVTGVGYDPTNGEVTLEHSDSPNSAITHPNLRRLVEIGSLCNNSSLKGGILYGQPTEGALLCLAAKMQIPDPRATNPRVKEWPFSSERKMMIVQVQTPRLSYQIEESEQSDECRIRPMKDSFGAMHLFFSY